MNEKSQKKENKSPPNSEVDEKIRQLEEERDEYINSWKRAKADLINYQKEEAKRLEETAKFSSTNIIKDIISVIANFELAIDALEKSSKDEDVEEVGKGLRMIKSQLEDILKRNGVIKINAEVGSKFDPMYHEAIAMVNKNDKLNSGDIAEEVERGYTMHGRVVKVAKVRVVE